jgi:hypothetical protein
VTVVEIPGFVAGQLLRLVGLARVGHRAVIMVCVVRLERGAAPTLYGEAPTFPTAATVTGARYGIPTQSGEGLPGAGVTPNGLG